MNYGGYIVLRMLFDIIGMIILPPFIWSIRIVMYWYFESSLPHIRITAGNDGNQRVRCNSQVNSHSHNLLNTCTYYYI